MMQIFTYYKGDAGSISCEPKDLKSHIRNLTLENSKNKIKHWYPNSRVLLTENKDWFESKFYFEANDIPDSAEEQMREWLKRIKSIANNY